MINKELINQMNPKFLEAFSKDELINIINSSSMCSKEYVAICTDNYFFEISLNHQKELIISYNNEENNQDLGILEKDDFLNLYK